MGLTLNFIADYLEAQGLKCTLIQDDTKDDLNDIRMLRPDQTSRRLDRLYICVPGKVDGAIDTEMHYILSGSDDPRFQQAHRVIVNSEVSTSLLYDMVLDLFFGVKKWQDNLKSVIISGGSIQELLEESSAIFDNSALSVVKADLQILGYVQNNACGNSLTGRNSVSGKTYLKDDRGLSDWCNPTGVSQSEPYIEIDHSYGQPCNVLRTNIITPVGEFLCRLTVSEATVPLHEYHKYLASFLSKCVYQILRRDMVSIQSSGTIGSEFLTDALLGKEQTQSVIDYGTSLLKFDANGLYRVFVFSSASSEVMDQTSIHTYLSRTIRSCLPDAKTVFISGATVLTQCGKKLGSHLEIIERITQAAELMPLNCGVSLVNRGIHSLGICYQQAAYAHALSIQRRCAVSYENCILDHAVDVFLEKHSVEGYTHPAIAKLARFDREHNSNLVETLYTYLISDRSYSYCSEKLSIHRSTLRYRIGQINDILELDYDDVETRLNLIISAKIYLSNLKRQ